MQNNINRAKTGPKKISIDEKGKIRSDIQRLLKKLYKDKKLTKNKYIKLDNDTYVKNITSLKKLYDDLLLAQSADKINYNIKKQIKKSEYLQALQVKEEEDVKSESQIVEEIVNMSGGVRVVNISNFCYTKEKTEINNKLLLGCYEKINSFMDQINNKLLIIKFHTLEEYKPIGMFINEYDLTQILPDEGKTKYNNTLKGIKNKLSRYWDRTYGSQGAYGNIEFITRDRAQPIKYNQQFKNAINSNCFMNAVKLALCEGQRVKTIKNIKIKEEKEEKEIDEETDRLNRIKKWEKYFDNKYDENGKKRLKCIYPANKKEILLKNEHQIKQLNDKFFKSGVKYSDIQTIANTLNINIIVKNKLGDIMHTSEKKLKTKTIEIVSPYINHVEFIKNNNITKKDKELIMIDDLQTHYENNNSSFKYFKKDQNDELLYYFDETKLYYKPFIKNDTIMNKDKYFIYDDQSYYENKFNDDNNINFNIISKNDNEYVFNEINNSVHHINDHTFNSNLEIVNEFVKSKLDDDIDDNKYEYINCLYEAVRLLNDDGVSKDDVRYKRILEQIDEYDDTDHDQIYYQNNNYTTYDNNKCFVGFINPKSPANKYYNEYKIPSNKYNAYNIYNDLTYDEIQSILSKTAIIKITNIKYNNNVVKELGYFKDNHNYTSAILKYCLDHELIEFKMTQIIEFFDKNEISFSDEIINGKYYNKIIGLMSHINTNNSTSFEFKNYDDIADLLYFSSDKISTYNIDKKIITINQENTNIFNKSHISSFILSYAFINILDVIKDIEYDNIIYVKCDAVTVKQKLNIITNKEIGGWKIEESKKLFTKSNINTYINIKNNECENKLFNYSPDKILYKKYNFISGGAGCGKTTRFLKAFDTDERVYNSLLLLPTNELLYGLQKNYPEINMMTYQSFLTHQQNVSKYTNIILDEVTMIGKNDFEKIRKMIDFYKQNIFVIGDYDIENKKSYQLQPINDDHFYEDINKTHQVYYKHLTVNYRQGSDIKFTKFLNSVRGKDNEYIKKAIMNNKDFTKIKYNDVVKNYKLGDKILSSVHQFIDKINKDIKPIDGKMQVLYKSTSGDHAKNETAIINESDFNKEHHKIGYCQTAHTAQGQTYDNYVYININNLFCDNILYVMISRAKMSGQLRIII
jgi:hypothetical protein